MSIDGKNQKLKSNVLRNYQFWRENSKQTFFVIFNPIQNPEENRETLVTF